MTRTRKDRTTVTSPTSDRRLTNAERCRLYREKMARDPVLLKKMRDDDKARAKRNREKLQTPEQIERQGQLRQRHKRYEERKKQKAVAEQASGMSRPKTRLDKEKLAKKRDANTLAVRKHRASWTAQKRRRVNEKRMARYYALKEATKVDELVTRQSPEVVSPTGCPFSNQETFKRAVRRVRAKIPETGRKFAHLLKGLIKHADKETSHALKEIHVTANTPEKNEKSARSLEEHLNCIKDKRDINTLRHKRGLAEAFKDCDVPG
ncbi:uncharacterized protein LOC143284204 [Babylonia areolata]|uniref:uncharacterized protein LOC143284204 n=1 Tax=Babylonia areolata TaxID=304850 RepID=UPI003FD4F94F